ncbi:unnamed protein product [Camellia sinensis]
MDCLELLNNLIRNNASNQVCIAKGDYGVDPLISILKLRGSSYSFNQQKTINLLSVLETIGLLIMGGPEIDTGKDANRLTNKAFVQIVQSEATLASTLIPQPQPTTLPLPKEDVNMSFGSMLLHGLTLSQNDGDLEWHLSLLGGRRNWPLFLLILFALVLAFDLVGHLCKERVLRIELEEPTPSLGAPEPLLDRVVKYLALASCMKSKEGKPNTSGNAYVQAIILKLLDIWHLDCPSVVQCFLDSRPHLTYLLELVSNSTVCIRGLAVVILGGCVIYNKSSDSGKDAFTIVDAISREVGRTSYFLKFEEMQKSIIFSSAKPAEPRKPLTRSTAASMAEIDDVEENEASDLKNEDHLMLASMFDAQFIDFIRNLEADIRESIVDVYSHPKSKVAVVLVELQQKGVIHPSLSIDLPVGGIFRGITAQFGVGESGPRRAGFRLPSLLHRDLQEASQLLDMLKIEKTKIESEASMYCNLAGKMESDLKSLSVAYNSLEQANFHLEKEIKALKTGGATPIPDVEAVKAEAREEAQKQSEAELNDLLVCLRQEQSKIEKLSVRLLELGEDVDKLLEGIGDDIGLLEDAEIEQD